MADDVLPDCDQGVKQCSKQHSDLTAADVASSGIAIADGGPNAGKQEARAEVGEPLLKGKVSDGCPAKGSQQQAGKVTPLCRAFAGSPCCTPKQATSKKQVCW